MKAKFDRNLNGTMSVGMLRENYMVVSWNLQKGERRSKGLPGHVRSAEREVEQKKVPAELVPAKPETKEVKNWSLDERVAEMHFAAVSEEEAM